MNSSAATSLVDVLLGIDRNQRVRVTQALVAAGVYLGLSVTVSLGVLMGLVDPVPAMALVVSVLGVSVLFYGLIRSGLNQRFTSDPALTQVQGFVCVLACCACYMVAPPLRGAVLMTMLVGQAFGIFALTPPQAWRMAALGVVALGLTMAGCAYVDPVDFPPRVEVLHFLLVVLVLPTIGWLTGTLSRIRHKLRQQKVQLESALAQNRLLATQDELTGLSNRRHMTTLMVAERGRQMRSRSPISMVLMDIDHFKRIND
ncbi:MAG: diguanylate cyclase, partial [Rhizobacter sp.]